MMGLLLPRVAGYREGSDSEGGKVRQQASNLCDLAVKYHLTQQVVATREKEILDFVWSSNPDLVSCIQVDTFPDITDHSVVTTTTSLRLENKQAKNKEFLLKSGKRLRQLDFAKDPWPEIQSKLRQVELGPIQDLAKTNVTAAHSLFMDTVLAIMEELVPPKITSKKFGHSKKHKPGGVCGSSLGE